MTIINITVFLPFIIVIFWQKKPSKFVSKNFRNFPLSKFCKCLLRTNMQLNENLKRKLYRHGFGKKYRFWFLTQYNWKFKIIRQSIYITSHLHIFGIFFDFRLPIITETIHVLSPMADSRVRGKIVLILIDSKFD